MNGKEDVHKLVSTAGLLLIDAMVFHEIIASFHKNVPTLSMLMTSQNLKKELEKSWQNIIQSINYEPVLEIALNILRNMPASPSFDKNLRALADLAYDIASSKVLLRHDLFGRIYHSLLLGKLVKYYATYYTSIPAARLLARLLINHTILNYMEKRSVKFILPYWKIIILEYTIFSRRWNLIELFFFLEREYSICLIRE